MSMPLVIGQLFIGMLFTLKALFGYEGVIWTQAAANYVAAVFAIFMLAFIYKRREIR